MELPNLLLGFQHDLRGCDRFASIAIYKSPLKIEMNYGRVLTG